MSKEFRRKNGFKEKSVEVEKDDAKDDAKENVVDFDTVYMAYRPRTENLSVLEGTTFIIKAVEFEESSRGEVAVVTVETTDGEKKYHTFSKVIIRQLKAIMPVLEKGYKVRATVVRTKRYLMLRSPGGGSV